MASSFFYRLVGSCGQETGQSRSQSSPEIVQSRQIGHFNVQLGLLHAIGRVRSPTSYRPLARLL